MAEVPPRYRHILVPDPPRAEAYRAPNQGGGGRPEVPTRDRPSHGASLRCATDRRAGGHAPHGGSGCPRAQRRVRELSGGCLVHQHGWTSAHGRRSCCFAEGCFSSRSSGWRGPFSAPRPIAARRRQLKQILEAACRASATPKAYASRKKSARSATTSCASGACSATIRSATSTPKAVPRGASAGSSESRVRNSPRSRLACRRAVAVVGRARVGRMDRPAGRADSRRNCSALFQDRDRSGSRRWGPEARPRPWGLDEDHSNRGPGRHLEGLSPRRGPMGGGATRLSRESTGASRGRRALLARWVHRRAVRPAAHAGPIACHAVVRSGPGRSRRPESHGPQVSNQRQPVGMRGPRRSPGCRGGAPRLRAESALRASSRRRAEGRPRPPSVEARSVRPGFRTHA